MSHRVLKLTGRDGRCIPPSNVHDVRDVRKRGFVRVKYLRMREDFLFSQVDF